MKWTVASLHQRVKKVFADDSLTFRLKELNGPNQAFVVSDGKNHYVAVDPSQDSPIRHAIHEVLHVVLSPELKCFDAKLSEAAILAWDDLLFRYVVNKPAHLKWWRRAVERKAAQ